MPDLIHVHYSTTGASTAIDALGMHEMQAQAYAETASRFYYRKMR